MNTDDLIGLPWERGARGPKAYDCWGLVLELTARAGLPMPADWNSCDLTRSEQRALMAGQAKARTVRLPGPADGAIAYSEQAGHAGFVLASRVIHARRGSGVVAVPFALWTACFPDSGYHAWRA